MRKVTKREQALLEVLVREYPRLLSTREVNKADGNFQAYETNTRDRLLNLNKLGLVELSFDERGHRRWGLTQEGYTKAGLSKV